MLSAREPWALALKVHEKIGYLESPGQFSDWQIYWVAGLVMLRSIGQVLDKKDKLRGDIHLSVISDHWKSSTFKRTKIFRDFIDGERNSLLKEFAWQVVPQAHTLSTLFDGRDYDELVAANGEFVALSWEPEGEDALRLYELALLAWHEELCVIEQVIEDGESKPFSSGLQVREDLLARSNFQETRPYTPRL